MTEQGTLGHELARMFAPPGACVWGQLCMYVCTGMANSPCSWCAGNMSPPRLPPVDRHHLLPGHLLHSCTVAGADVPRRASTGTGGRCGRASLCAHGRAMPVTRLRARRLSRADAMGSLTRPAAGALATCAPPDCRRGTVVTCSRAIYSTVAPLQVLACLVVRARARGAGAVVPRCARTGAPCL
jgi:hypothetical protein